MALPKGHKPRPAQDYINAFVDLLENNMPVGEVQNLHNIANSAVYNRRNMIKQGKPAAKFFGRSEFNERQREQYEALCEKFGTPVRESPPTQPTFEPAPAPAPAPVHQPVYVEDTEATQKKIRRLEQTIEMLWDRIDALEAKNG